jgi:hypothetical protein
VSRGWIIIVTFKCPEVGLEFSPDAPPTKELDRESGKEWLKRFDYMGGESRGRVESTSKEGSRTRKRGASTAKSPVQE